MTERSNEDVVLRIVGLTVGSGRDQVLDQVSLDVYRGDRLGIVSNSGAGTSSLASAMINDLPDTATSTGEIIYYPADSEPVNVLQLGTGATRRFRWKTVSVIERNPANSFNPTMTIRNHFEETLRAHGANVRDGVAYSRRLLSEVDLDPERILDAYPDDLTADTKQRAAVVLGLVLEPEIVVFDGLPSVFNSPVGRSQFDALQSHSEFTTIFLSTDPAEIAAFAARIAIMYEGDIVETGPTREIFGNPTHPYTRTLLESVPGGSLDPS
jgi:ABC-type dipeptide/oligopeptide/nickel transport system ATPase component